MQSIYTNYAPPKGGISPSDLVAFYFTEITSCEDLLKLGYTHSNGVNLVEQINFLQGKIKLLEGQKGERI